MESITCSKSIRDIFNMKCWGKGSEVCDTAPNKRDRGRLSRDGYKMKLVDIGHKGG